MSADQKPDLDTTKQILDRAIQELRKAVTSLGGYHMNSCVKCGLCGETCHVYLTDPVPENLPGYKAAKVIRHFKRYYTLMGRIAPAWIGARDITLDTLDEMVEFVYGRCTGCGRCGIHCSIGTDVGSIIRAGRKILASINKVPANLQVVVDNQLNTGNQMAISTEELKETAAWLAEDLQMEMKDDTVVLPVDTPGKRILYLINPREVKFFPLSLMAAAGVFHAARESWTLSSTFFDVTNYGLFSGDDRQAGQITRQVIEEAQKLGVEEVILGECGHGFRSFRWEGPNWMNSAYPVPVRSVLLLLKEFLDSGRIKVDPSKNTERVTLHDPCNLVRWGGIMEPQREILRRVVSDFQEMTPNREHNYCCGGGGGMLSMSEYGSRRVGSGKIKADQVRATGARIVAAPCHNCADQFLELSKKYQLGIEVQSVVELVFNALVLP